MKIIDLASVLQTDEEVIINNTFDKSIVITVINLYKRISKTTLLSKDSIEYAYNPDHLIQAAFYDCLESVRKSYNQGEIND